MATSLGKLVVTLTAKTKRFERKILRAGRAVKKFVAPVFRAGLGVAKFGALLGGAVLAGLALYTRRAFGAIDATAKLSDELGISTEALTGYEHAAALSGTKNETLTKGFQRLARRIGEAASGYGEGVKSLEQLGLKADELTSLSTDEAMLRVADSIASIENPAKRAAAAYGLFGRQGQELMNFLMMGKKGMLAARRDMELLGGSFGRIDAAKVEEANDALTRTGKAVRGVANRLAIVLAPTVTKVANFLTEKFIWARQSIASQFGSILKTAKRWAVGVAGAFLRVGFVITQRTDLIAFSILKWQLRLVELKHNFLNIFTGIIPTTLKWLVTNWKSIFEWIADFTLTTFENLGTNIVAIVKNIPDLIRGKVDFGDIWKPLTDGMVATVADFPDVFTRELSSEEKMYMDAVESMSERIGKNYTRLVQKPLEKVRGLVDRVTSKDEALSITPAPELKDLVKKGIGVASGPKFAGAHERGSVAAYSASLRGRQASGQKAAEKAAVETSRTTKALQKIGERLLAEVENMNAGQPGVATI